MTGASNATSVIFVALRVTEIPEPFWVIRGNKVKCPICDTPLKTYVKYRNHYIRRHSLDRVKSQTLVLKHDSLPKGPPVAKKLIEAELNVRQFLHRFNRIKPRGSTIQAIGKGDNRVELTEADLQQLVKMAAAYDGMRGLMALKDMKPSEKYRRIHTIIKAMEQE